MARARSRFAALMDDVPEEERKAVARQVAEKLIAQVAQRTLPAAASL
jgi:hypothetical protein